MSLAQILKSLETSLSKMNSVKVLLRTTLFIPLKILSPRGGGDFFLPVERGTSLYWSQEESLELRRKNQFHAFQIFRRLRCFPGLLK